MCPPTSRGSGETLLQISMQFGQRVWNLHPEGGFAGEGIDPFRSIRSILAVGSGIGMAENSARV